MAVYEQERPADVLNHWVLIPAAVQYPIRLMGR